MAKENFNAEIDVLNEELNLNPLMEAIMNEPIKQEESSFIEENNKAMSKSAKRKNYR